MSGMIRRLGILAALTAIVLFFGMLIASSYSHVGVACVTGTGGVPLSVYEFSDVPLSVFNDASGMAAKLYGDSQEKCNDFTRQLLTTYEEVKDKDFVIFFNSGGWGSNLVETTRGWWTISEGIQLELNGSGYSSLALNYIRTVRDIRGCLNELMEMFTDYPSKAKDLAYRVEFITGHVPEAMVILVGESLGAAFTDSVMKILKDNPRVYSIQTGPPPWHNNLALDRTLLIDDNGMAPDSFSRGDIVTILNANLKVLLGMSRADDEPGRIMHIVIAPGHYYSWQYVSIYSQITGFFDENFGLNSR